eukprot:1159394-Pelagomonas_calceolata.AAC.9
MSTASNAASALQPRVFQPCSHVCLLDCQPHGNQPGFTGLVVHIPQGDPQEWYSENSSAQVVMQPAYRLFSHTHTHTHTRA